MKNDKPIIIKKVRKHHGGHHGGSWKVAYADFVTAMMAFFLLLWLITMVSPEKRARLSAYFKYFSLYTSGGTSWMEKSSEIFGESGENRQKVFTDLDNSSISNAEGYEALLNEVSNDLKKDISDRLGGLRDQVIVDIVDEGIRIQMTDKDGSSMFERGSTRLTPKAKEVLRVLSENLNKLPNKIIIEGHTDSLPYAGSQYSNWELSTERASSARIELEADGLDPARIARVAGYADTDPLVKDNPADPRNRRISIILQDRRRHAVNAESKKTKDALTTVPGLPGSGIGASDHGEIHNIQSPGSRKRILELIDNNDGRLHEKNREKRKSIKNEQQVAPERSEKKSVIDELSNPVLTNDNLFPPLSGNK